MEFPPLDQIFNDQLRQKISTRPVHSNRLSQIGHCLRKQFLLRTKWDQALPHDIGLQRIFELGNEWEHIVGPRLSNVITTTPPIPYL